MNHSSATVKETHTERNLTLLYSACNPSDSVLNCSLVLWAPTSYRRLCGGGSSFDTLIGCVSHGAVGRRLCLERRFSQRAPYDPQPERTVLPGLSVCYYQPRLYLLLKVPPDSSRFALHCRSGFTPPYTYRTKPLASRLVAFWLAAEPNAKTERDRPGLEETQKVNAPNLI